MLSNGDEKEENTTLELQGILDLIETPLEQHACYPFILRTRSEEIQLLPWSKIIALSGTNKRQIPSSVKLEGPIIMDLTNIIVTLKDQ